MLDRLPGIRHACEIDLLLFFYRHRRALLTSEQLVAYLGYDRKRIAKSLDALVGDRLLMRSLNPTHAAHLYVLELGGHPGELLSPLLELAATREGRLGVMRLLAAGSDRGLVPISQTGLSNA
jgi:hypothetical protein